jgi:hypothetical protein
VPGRPADADVAIEMARAMVITGISTIVIGIKHDITPITVWFRTPITRVFMIPG